MLVYAGLAEHEREELVEGDVLHHGRHDVTRLLRSESTSKFIILKTKENIQCRIQSKISLPGLPVEQTTFLNTLGEDTQRTYTIYNTSQNS